MARQCRHILGDTKLNAFAGTGICKGYGYLRIGYWHCPAPKINDLGLGSLGMLLSESILCKLY